MPADRSLLSKMVQGSKFFRPRRRSVRISGSIVMLSPVGSFSVVGSLMSGLSEPKRTLRPAW